MSVVFLKDDPPGTALLRLGYTSIQAINNNLLAMFGQAATATFGAPFSFFDAGAQAVGRLSVIDPVNPQEIAPKHLVDGKVTYSATLTSTDGMVYSGTTTPDITGAYDPGALYLVTNSGPVNTGPVSLQLGTGGAFTSVRRADGAELAAGDLAAGQTALLAYLATPTNQFRFINFIGGTLAADPTLAFDAATKQYVDRVVNPPNARVGMTVATVALTANGTGAPIITVPTITIPPDGQYDVFAEFLCYVHLEQPALSAMQAGLWVNDGTDSWAFTGNAFVAGAAIGCDWIAAGSGFAPTSYAAGATVNIKLQGAAVASPPGPPNNLFAQQSPFVGFGAAGAPTSYMAVTLMRTHT